LIAAAIFLVLAVVSFRALPEGVELRPLFMVAIALGAAPATLLLNALEYRAMAKAVGHRVGLGSAARVSLLATLANYLPAPGGVAVRTAALKLQGSSIGSALSINAIAGIIWVGATALLVGAALLTRPDFAERGLVVIAAGAAILAGSALVLRRRPGWRRAFVELLLIEAGTTLVAALRVALAFAAIRQSIAVSGAVTIASAQVIAAAVGIFPAGLGIREAIAAGLAVTVQASAAAAVAASAVDRLAALVGLTLCAPVLGLSMRSLTARAEAAGEASGAPARDARPSARQNAALLGSAMKSPDREDP
jgi:hypothetical protein